MVFLSFSLSRVRIRVSCPFLWFCVCACGSDWIVRIHFDSRLIQRMGAVFSLWDPSIAYGYGYLICMLDSHHNLHQFYQFHLSFSPDADGIGTNRSTIGVRFDSTQSDPIHLCRAGSNATCGRWSGVVLLLWNLSSRHGAGCKIRSDRIVEFPTKQKRVRFFLFVAQRLLYPICFDWISVGLKVLSCCFISIWIRCWLCTFFVLILNWMLI